MSFRHSLVLSTDDRVFSTGLNNAGQLGLGHFNTQASWAEVPILSGRGIIGMAAGLHHSVWLTANEGVCVSGDASRGQCGDRWEELAGSSGGGGHAPSPNSLTGLEVDQAGEPRRLAQPLRVSFVSKSKSKAALHVPNGRIVRASCGYLHTLLMTEEGELFAFGSNEKLQCGQPADQAIVKTPTLIPLRAKVADITTGAHFSAAVSEVGEVYTWGSNVYGQLGRGHTVDSVEMTPVPALSGRRVHSIAAGFNHLIVLSAIQRLVLPPQWKQLLQRHVSTAATPSASLRALRTWVSGSGRGTGGAMEAAAWENFFAVPSSADRSQVSMPPKFHATSRLHTAIWVFAREWADQCSEAVRSLAQPGAVSSGSSTGEAAAGQYEHEQERETGQESSGLASLHANAFSSLRPGWSVTDELLKKELERHLPHCGTAFYSFVSPLVEGLAQATEWWQAFVASDRKSSKQVMARRIPKPVFPVPVQSLDEAASMWVRTLERGRQIAREHARPLYSIQAVWALGRALSRPGGHRVAKALAAVPAIPHLCVRLLCDAIWDAGTANDVLEAASVRQRPLEGWRGVEEREGQGVGNSATTVFASGLFALLRLLLPLLRPSDLSGAVEQAIANGFLPLPFLPILGGSKPQPETPHAGLHHLASTLIAIAGCADVVYMSWGSPGPGRTQKGRPLTPNSDQEALSGSLPVRVLASEAADTLRALVRHRSVTGQPLRQAVTAELVGSLSGSSLLWENISLLAGFDLRNLAEAHQWQRQTEGAAGPDPAVLAKLQALISMWRTRGAFAVLGASVRVTRLGGEVALIGNSSNMPGGQTVAPGFGDGGSATDLIDLGDSAATERTITGGPSGVQLGRLTKFLPEGGASVPTVLPGSGVAAAPAQVVRGVGVVLVRRGSGEMEGEEGQQYDAEASNLFNLDYDEAQRLELFQQGLGQPPSPSHEAKEEAVDIDEEGEAFDGMDEAYALIETPGDMIATGHEPVPLGCLLQDSDATLVILVRLLEAVVGHLAWSGSGCSGLGAAWDAAYWHLRASASTALRCVLTHPKASATLSQHNLLAIMPELLSLSNDGDLGTLASLPTMVLER